MAQSILDDRLSTVYPENHVCENCLHWLGDERNKIHAKIGGSTLWVGQCIGQEERDDAPYADLDNGAEAFVFTPCNGRCKAFEMHPDLAADDEDMRETYRSLDRGLLLDAWRV